MHRHRLDRLSLLTRGVVLVGCGLAQVACEKEAPPANVPPDHVNAPPRPDPPSSASTAPAPPEAPHVNAPPDPPPKPTAAPSASASALPSSPARTPDHVNSPKPTKPTPK